MQPLIVFDIDGTLTDFRAFIRKYGVPYFEKRGMAVSHPDALELEDIFDFSSHYPPEMQKELLDEFWVSYRFILFSLLDRYRRDAVKFVRSLKRSGFGIELHTSRAKTCEKTPVGVIARGFTIMQCWLSGVFIPRSAIHFWPDDNTKVAAIADLKPVAAFDDKDSIVDLYAEKGVRLCMITEKCAEEPRDRRIGLERIEGFGDGQALSALRRLLGVRNFGIVEKEAQSNRFFQQLLPTGAAVRRKYKPIMLNAPRLTATGAVLYAPNHIRTVDPLVIESVLKEHIHWVALKRFFDGKDSIFNNSKNPLLCSLTSFVFRKLEYFPIERKQDADKPNNYQAIRDMGLFLRNGFRVGIFPEGTTRKENGQFFGTLDRGFVELAKRTGATIQPILIYWTRQKRPLLYFGEPIETAGHSTERLFQMYMESQNDGLQKCEKRSNTIPQKLKEDAHHA